MTTANVGALGIKVTILAIPAFPQGFTIEEFGSDGDPVDIQDVEVTQTAMGVNGDLETWNKAAAIPVVLNSIIPKSEADNNLQILTNMIRASKNKVSIQNDITMTVSYPDGSLKTLTGGVLLVGKVANSATSDSRLRTNSYSFTFQNII